MLPVVSTEEEKRGSDVRQSSLSTIRSEYRLPAIAVGCVRAHPQCQRPMSCAVYVSGVRKMRDVTVTETAARVSDRFILGSCTKAMTATVLAILIERGLLTWDTTLPLALPSLASQMHPAYTTVTLAMLSSHTAGLPREAAEETRQQLAAAPVLSARRNAVTQLLTDPPALPPCSQFVYSNAGYIVLGAIMEECTGRSWEELIVDELFAPLGITNYGFGCQANLQQLDVPDQPWPHLWRGGQVATPINPLIHSGANALWRAPCGGVNCSMDEWGKFAQLHIDGFHGRPTAVLTPSSFAMLHCAATAQHNYTYGAWRRQYREWAGGDTLSHGGGNKKGCALIWIAPLRNVAYVAVTNVAGEGERGGKKALDVAISKMIAIDRRTGSEQLCGCELH